MKTPLGGSGVLLTRSKPCCIPYAIIFYSKGKAKYRSENVLLLLLNICSRLYVNRLVFVVVDLSLSRVLTIFFSVSFLHRHMEVTFLSFNLIFMVNKTY